MEKRKTVKPVHRELRALLKQSPWVLVSLLLAAVLWQTDTAAISGLFQSVQSPVATATALPPTATALPPTATPTEQPTLVPTEVPTVASPTVITETLPLTATATLTPTTMPTSTPMVTATVAPSATPLSSPSPTADAALTDSERYPGEDPALRFEWGMLFDSVALGISYAWLCCGVLLLVSIPVVFVILWVVSKRRQEQSE